MQIYILSAPQHKSPNQLLVRRARLAQSRRWAYKLVMSIFRACLRPEPFSICYKDDEGSTNRMVRAAVKKYNSAACSPIIFWKYRESSIVGLLDFGWRIRAIRARTGETVYAIESN